MQHSGQLRVVVHKQLDHGRRHHAHLKQSHLRTVQPPTDALKHRSPSFSAPHHHGDEGEEIPVALDPREAERKYICEEDHGGTEADGAEDLREERKRVISCGCVGEYVIDADAAARTTAVRLLEVSRFPEWKEKRTMHMLDRMK